MTHRPASLALRLTLSIGAVITVVLLTFGWVVERSISDHFAQQDVDELNAVLGIARAQGLDAASDALVAKLGEECAEFATARSLEELADVLEVVRALAAVFGSLEDLERARQVKRASRGGFENRTWLVSTDS